jgi:DNA-directed RNA polymerase subunit H (RpoH/RPB5)
VHLKEMLDMRGEDTTEFEEHGDAVPRPRYFTDPTRIILNTNKTTVFFALSKDVLKELLKEFKDVEDFEEEYKTKNFIIVVMELPSSTTMNTLLARDKTLQQNGGMLQVFTMKELLYNPSKHVLVPAHKKLSEDETKEVLEKYMIKSKAQLPQIHRTDIMARWLGLRHGDVVRITRYNPTSGEYFYYRCYL